MDCVYDIQMEPAIEKTAADAYREGNDSDEDYDSESTSNVHEDVSYSSLWCIQEMRY